MKEKRYSVWGRRLYSGWGMSMVSFGSREGAEKAARQGLECGKVLAEVREEPSRRLLTRMFGWKGATLEERVAE